MVKPTSASTASSSAYVDTTSPTKQSNSKNVDISDQIKMIQDYFTVFDGSPHAAKRFQAAFAKTFHPDAVIEYPGGSLSYEDAIIAITAVCDRGGYADLEDIVDNGDGTATMTVNNHLPKGPKDDVTRQLVHFKDGKILRVRAIDADSEQFGEVIKLCLACSADDIADKYAAMLKCFDGSSGAFDRAEPIIDEVFAEDLVIDYGTGNFMDLAAFKVWAATFDREQNIAKCEDIKAEDNKLFVKIRNIVDGVDQGPVDQVGVIKNGKIVHWSADAANEDGFDTLITSVWAQSQRMAGNIQRFRDYLAAFDGSPNAWERVEPHIERVLSPDLVWDDADGARPFYEELISMIRNKYIPNGCYPVLESLVDNKDGSVTVEINNRLPGEDGDVTRQVLHFGDDGRINRFTAPGLSDTFERVQALPN